MTTLTMKQMDAILRRMLRKRGYKQLDDDIRAAFIEGLRAGAQVKSERRDIPPLGYFARGFDSGHDAHQRLLARIAGKLSREVKL